MDMHQHGTGLNRANRYHGFGRLALVVLTVLCVANLPLSAAEETGLDGLLDPVFNESNKEVAATFDWDDLVPGPDLNYTACYGGFQCARLELPMDHLNQSVKDNISLAVIRQPAANNTNVTSPRYGGAILYNPGGPGESGIRYISSTPTGEEMSRIADTQDNDLGLYFDIISFDPRGVGHSRPQMNCPDYDPKFNESKDTLQNLWQDAKEQGEKCSLPPSDGQADIKSYMTSHCVAQDVMALVEAHGRWREQQGLQLLAKDGKHGIEKAPGESWKYRPGLEKLQFWGVSYGTFLGATFATMYPNKTERMIADGVVDADDYIEGLDYHRLDDTEKAMDQFYSDCARVGLKNQENSVGCALANRTGTSTAEGVKARVQNILSSAKRMVTREKLDEIDATIYDALHNSIDEFPSLASFLAVVENALTCKEKGNDLCQLLPSKSEGVSTTWTSADGLVHANNVPAMGITCTDGNDRSGVSEADFEEHLKHLEDQSSYFGRTLINNINICTGYSIRPRYRFTGPWEGNTSHPILFVGNTADPTTPLRNAIKMAKGFKGAVVLTQNSTGHGLKTTTSNCTENHIRSYFQHGTLPSPGEICEASEHPFDRSLQQWPSFGMRPIGR